MVTWYADSDDPYYIWRTSGRWIVVVFLLPVILAGCVAASHPGPGARAAILVSAIPLLVGIVAAAWEFVADRRAVVEMRLTPSELTVPRVDRSTTTYRVGDVRGVELIRTVRADGPGYAHMRLPVRGRAERTRRGPADLPESWVEALNGAEIDLRIRSRRFQSD